jgi:hypothetical protein
MSKLTVKSPQECIDLLLTSSTNKEVTSIIEGTTRYKQENGEPFGWANHIGNALWYWPLPCEWEERRDSAIRIAKQYVK